MRYPWSFALLCFVSGCSCQTDLRPKYHFRKNVNWMNDVCGPFFWNGWYHLFWQDNPNSPDVGYGNIGWGHAVSQDLVFWTILPEALLPGHQSYDFGGVYDGSAFLTENGPMVVYAGSMDRKFPPNDFTMNLAWPTNLSDPHLVKWTKAPYNPIVPKPPAGYFWPLDPSEVWQDQEGNYRFINGVGHNNFSAATLIYVSPDLVNWTFDGEFFGNPGHDNGSWYCIELFELQGRYVFSTDPVWAVGIYDNVNVSYTPKTWGMYDDGGDCVCSKSFWDGNKGRRVALTWMPEQDSIQNYTKRGWAGTVTLPRVLTLSSDNQMIANPIPELMKLRQQRVGYRSLALHGNMTKVLADHGNAFEIIAVLSDVSSSLEQVGVRVLMSPTNVNGSEYTDIGLWPAQGKFGIDRTYSSLDGSLGVVATDWTPTDVVTLRIFVDVSVVELYVNDGAYRMANRVYPTLDTSIGVALYSVGKGMATFHSIDIWQMASIW